MAVSQATRTAYSNALRVVYTPKMWKLQNRDRILLQIIKKNSEQWAEGSLISIPLHTAGSGGVGYSSSGALPTAGVQQTEKASANYKRLYGRLQVDGALMKSTSTGYAAEARALEFETKNLIEDIGDAKAYDVWQDGTGKIAGTLSLPSGGASTTAFRVPKANFGIRKNAIIDVRVTSSGAAGTNGGTALRVASVAPDTNDTTLMLVTLDSETPLAGTGDITSGGPYSVYRQGSRNDAIDGMASIVSASGTYLGINRATAGNEFWKAQVMANGGTLRPVTLDLMQEMVDQIEINSPGMTRLIVTNHAIWRQIADLLVADKRYKGESMKLNGWCEAVEFRGIPIVRDKYAPANKMWFLDTDTWTFFQDSDGGFIDEDGQILKQVANFDKFEAAWRQFFQLVCGDPASNGLLSDILE